MKTQTTHIIFKAIFSIFMVFSALGELTFHGAVTHSMEMLQMPAYLLYLLGVLKLLGVAALWFSPVSWLKEWAYAGFIFDFVGAIYGFIAVGQPVFPDVFLAPFGLMLCSMTYFLWKKSLSMTNNVHALHGTP